MTTKLLTNSRTDYIIKSSSQRDYKKGGGIVNINLKKYRIKAGLTQKDMASKLGYKYTSGYNQLETGKRRINVEIAKKLSEILCVSIEELFFTKEVVGMTTEGNGDFKVVS